MQVPENFFGILNIATEHGPRWLADPKTILHALALTESLPNERLLDLRWFTPMKQSDRS